MAEFELNIYGNNDEILKKYATSHIRWGVLLQALKLDEQLDGASAEQQFDAISELLKKLFPELTDEEIQNADYSDVINTFKQILNKANKLDSGEPKN